MTKQEPTEHNESETAPSQSQAEIARHAMELKQAAPPAEPHPINPPEADDGMASNPREGYPASGAFDAEGQRPVLERSRKVR